jgi:tetratricopeptide (TPR) repeat protein
VQHGRTLPQWLAGGAVLALIALGGCAGTRRAGPSKPTVATVERAEAAELRRDHATARQLYLDAIAAAPDPASEAFARRELAETLFSWRELAAGRDQLETVVTLVPDDAGAWHDLGFVRYKLGDEAGGIEAVTRSRDLAPKDYRPRRTLAMLYWRSGDRASALAEYQALHRLELPPRLRQSVEWAIRELSRPPS